jgi:hypothetical protein
MEVFRIVLVLILVSSFLRLVFVVLMKHMEDKFGVNQELKVLGLNSLVSGIFCGIIVFWPSLQEAVSLPFFWYFVYFIPICLSTFLAHCYCVFSLISQVRKHNFKSAENSNFSTDVPSKLRAPTGPSGEITGSLNELKTSTTKRIRLERNAARCPEFDEKWFIHQIQERKGVRDCSEDITRKWWWANDFLDLNNEDLKTSSSLQQLFGFG